MIHPGLNERIMLLIKTELVKNVLKSMHRNQSFLAEKLGLHKSSLSKYLNNQAKLSPYFIEGILNFTNIPYEILFYSDGKPDTREFWGDTYVMEGQTMRLPKYKDTITAKKNEMADEVFA